MAVPNLTANSPTNGSIAWSAFTIQYGGVGYGITGGSTALKYVWWVYNNGSPVLTASDTMPTNLTADDIVLFVNKSGIPINVPSSTVVDGSLVVDGTIVGSAVIAGTLHGDRIQAGTITAGLLAADTITATQIAAGAIGASEIAANAVTASKLVITNLSNMVEDGSFEKDLGSWGLATGATIATVAGLPHGGTKVLRHITAATVQDTVPVRTFDVTPGEVYYAEALVRKTTTGVTGNLHLGTTITNDGASPQYPMAQQVTMGSLVQNAWTKLSGMVTIPAGQNRLQLRLSTRNDIPAGEIVEWDNVILRKASSGELIVDGSITTNKMTADSINGDRIAAGTLNASKVVAGSITGDRIAANAISASKIAISDFTNLIADGDLTDATLSNWGTGITRTAQAGNEPAYIEWPTNAGSNAHRSNLHGWEARNGDKFYFEVEVSTPASNTVTANFVPALRIANAAGSVITWPQLTTVPLPPNTGWTKVAGVIPIASSNSSRAILDFFTNSGATAGQVVRVRNIIVRRQNGGELIVDGAIATTKLAADAVTADKVAAGAVTARSLAIGDLTNYASGSDFEGTHPWTLAANGSIDATVAYKGTKSLKIDGTKGTGSQTLQTPITVTEGDQLYVEFYARRDAAWNGSAGNSKFRFGAKNNANAFVSDINYAATTLTVPDVWQKRFGFVTIGAGVTSLETTLTTDATAGNVWLDNLEIRRLNRGELIVDGTITATKIGADQITATHLATDSVTAKQIAANAVTATEIAADTITATQIAAGAIGASEIAANAVTANKIAVGDFTNYVPDPNFAFGGNYYLAHTVYNSTDAANVPQANVPPGKVAKLAGTYDLFAVGNDDGFPLVEGDEFYIDAWVCHTGAGTASLGMRLWASTTQTISGDGALMGWAYPQYVVTAASAQDAWIKVSGTVKIPANTTSGKNDPLITGWAGLTTGLDPGWFITGWNVRRKSGGELIVDGAVTATKIGANAVEADKIKSGAVEADKIAANAITANKLNVVMGGENLWTNSSFEDSNNYLAGWGGQYDNDTVSTISKVAGRLAGSAARVAWSNAGGSVKGLFRPHPTGFKVGELYTLSFYARASATVAAANKPMVHASNIPFVNHVWTRNPNLTTSWQRYVFTFGRTSDTADPVFFGVSPSGLTAGAHHVEFDDLQLEDGDVATAYSPRTDEILPGTINTAMLSANAVEAGNIKAGAVTTDKMTAGSINGDRITGATITASKLAVSDFNNYAGDGLFMYGKTGWTGGGTVITSTTEPNALEIVSAVGDNADNYAEPIALKGGESYAVSFEVRGDPANTSWHALNLHIACRNFAGTGNSWPAVSITAAAVQAAAGTWIPVSGVITIPADAETGKVGVAVGTNGTAGSKYRFRNIVVRKRGGGELIVDGGISAAHLAAGAVTANKLNVVMGGGNLVPNSSFEDATLPGWGYNLCTGATSTAYAKHGTRSLRLLSAAAPGSDSYATFTMPGLTSGATYTVSAWLYVESITGAANQSRSMSVINAANTSGLGSDLSLTTAHVTGKWVRKTVTATVPAGDTSVRVRLYCPVGAVHWDSVQIEEGDVATSYTPKTDEILPGTINTAHIAADTITSTQIATAGLDAQVIKFGTMSGERIAARTLTANKIAVGDFNNLVSNPEMKDQLGWGGISGSTTWTAAWGLAANGNYRSGWAMKTAQSQGAYLSLYDHRTIPAAAGDQFHLSAKVADVAPANIAPTLRVIFYDASGTNIGNVGTSNAGTGGLFVVRETTITAPANTASMRVWVEHYGGTDPAKIGEGRIGDMTVRRLAGGELIVDGAITATKIAVGAVEANKLNVVVGGGNLISNSGFENPLDFKAGWLSNATVTRETTAALVKQGTSAASLPGVAGNVIYRDVGGLTPGVTYTASVYVYNSGWTTGRKAYLRLHDTTEAGMVASGDSTDVNKWQRLSVKFVATSTRAARIHGYVGESGTTVFDSFQLEEGDVATSYTPKTDEILPGTINATHIAAGSITSTLINTSGLSADVIKTGVMSADRIDSNTLTISKVKDLQPALDATNTTVNMLSTNGEMFTERPDGLNKWLFSRYNGANTPGVIPGYDQIKNRLADSTSLISDGATLVSNVGDNYVGHLRTLVTATASTNVVLQMLHDDGGAIYLNGVRVYGNTVYTTAAAVNFTVPAGRHVLDIFWNEQVGGDGVSGVTPTFGSFFSRLCAPANDASVAAAAALDATAKADAARAAALNAGTALVDNCSTTALWTKFGGVGTFTTDGNTLKTVGNANFVRDGQKIPYSADQLYRLTVRYRQTAQSTDGLAQTYIGLAGFNEAGNPVNTTGANGYGSQHYPLLSAAVLPASSTWTTRTVYIKGFGAGGAGTYDAKFLSPLTPAVMHTSVRSVAPIVYSNHPSQTTGTFEVDEIIFEPTTAGEILAAQVQGFEQTASNTNATFTDWTGTTPTGWVQWGGNPLPTKNTADAVQGEYAVELSPVGAAGSGIQESSALDNLPIGLQYVTVELDVMLKAGTFDGAGVLLDWSGYSGGGRDAVRLKDIIPAPSLNRWYKVSKVLKRNPSSTGTHTGWGAYLMASYSGDGLGNQTAKTIVYDRVAFRPSSAEEINAFEAPADATAKAATARTNAVGDIKGLWGHASDTTRIDGGDIYTGTVTANSIAAGTITAAQLAVADFSNYWSNPYNALAAPTVGAASAEVPPVGTARTIGFRDHISGGAGREFPVALGEKYFVEVTAKRTAGTRTLNGGVYITDAGYSGPWQPATCVLVADLGNGWGRYRAGVRTIAKDGAGMVPTKACLYFQIDQPGGGPFDTTWHVADIMLRRQSGGELIVDGSIVADKIDVAAVTATKIAAGAVVADKIAAGAVTTDKLTVASVGDNLILNGNFVDLVAGKPYGWIAESPTTNVIGMNVVGTDYYLQVATSATPAGSVFQHEVTGLIPAAPGDQFHVEVGASSTGGGHTFQLLMHCYSRDGAYVGGVTSDDLLTNDSAAAFPSSNRLSAVLTAPTAGGPVSAVRFGLRCTTPSATYLFDKYVVGKVSVSARIADGAITADKILTNAIIARHIKTREIESDKIKVGAITADLIHLSTKGFAVNENSNMELEATDANGNLLGYPAGWNVNGYFGGVGTLGYETVAPLSGVKSAKIVTPANAKPRLYYWHNINDPAANIPVQPGDKWYFSVRVKAVGGDNVANSTAGIAMKTAQPGYLAMDIPNGNTVTQQWVSLASMSIANGQETTLEGSLTVPDGHRLMRFMLELPARTAACEYIVDDFVCHPAVNDAQITEISPGKIVTGFLKAGQRILAGATETGARVEMRGAPDPLVPGDLSEGFYAFNSSGARTFTVRASDGEAIIGNPGAIHITMASYGPGWGPNGGGAAQGMIRFKNPGQGDGNIFSQYWYDQSDHTSYGQGAYFAALRLQSPTRDNNGSTPAFLDLRNTELGKSRFHLEADMALISANTFIVGGKGGATTVDFRQGIGSTGWTFTDFSSQSRLNIYNDLGQVRIRATDGRNGLVGNAQKMVLNASEIELLVSGDSLFVNYQGSQVGMRHWGQNTGYTFARNRAVISNFANNLHVGIEAASFQVNSDPRLKNNAARVDGALSVVRSLPAYDYDMKGILPRKSTHAMAERQAADAKRGKHVEIDAERARGLMADEVRALLPDAVHEDEKGFLSISLYDLTATLWAAVRELDAKVTAMGDKPSPTPTTPVAPKKDTR